MPNRESKLTGAVEAWERQAGMPDVDAVIKRVRVLRREAKKKGVGKQTDNDFRKLIDQAMGELGVPKDQREDMRLLVGKTMGKRGGAAAAESRKVFRAINDELGENRERADSRQLKEELERGGYESREEMYDDINK